MRLQQSSADRQVETGKNPKKSEIKMTPTHPLILLIKQESTCNLQILDD